MDVAYARGWSLGLDLRLLCRTPLAAPEHGGHDGVTRAARRRPHRGRRPRLLGAEPRTQPARAPRRRGRAVCDARRSALDAITRRYPAIARRAAFETVARRPDDRRGGDRHAGFDALRARVARARRRQARVRREAAGRPRRRRPPTLIELADERGLVLMPGHTFLYSPPVDTIRDAHRRAATLGDIYFVSTSRVNLGLHQADVSVVVGPRPARLLDPPLLARRDARPRVGPEPRLRPPGHPGCRLRQPRVPVRARSPTSSSPGSRRASCGGRRSSARRRWSSTTTRATSRSGSSTAASMLPDPETFGEYRLTYRTGDIVSPAVAAAEPLRLEMADFCDAHPHRPTAALLGGHRSRGRSHHRGGRRLARRRRDTRRSRRPPRRYRLAR